jgi:prepilin-type N-terminal cleavage/methylation domain-containing protein
MKRRRGYTLVELVVALALASVVGLVAGRLLVDALDAWQAEADRTAALRSARTILDTLADDLAAQPLRAPWPEPAGGVDLDPANAPAGLYIVGRDARVRAVAWVRQHGGDLWRLESGPEATDAALPANAAAQALAAGDAAALRALGAVRIAARVAALHPVRSPADALEAAQVQLTLVTAQGAAELETGTPLDAALADALPPRMVHRTARVIPPR